jgi:hypothetical protein
LQFDISNPGFAFPISGFCLQFKFPASKFNLSNFTSRKSETQFYISTFATSRELIHASNAMLNTTVHRILLAASLVAVALLADAWRTARRDSAQLTAILATEKSTLQQATDREKLRDSQLSAALAAITSQKRAVRTPQQAAAAIPSVLPPLPLPISIHLPDLSPSAKPIEVLPATISIPQSDLKPLYDDLQDCQASALENAAAQKNLADEKLRSVALTRERDAAITAARGGTFWQRLKREVKWFAIGIAAGATASAAARR